MEYYKIIMPNENINHDKVLINLKTIDVCYFTLNNIIKFTSKYGTMYIFACETNPNGFYENEFFISFSLKKWFKESYIERLDVNGFKYYSKILLKLGGQKV